MQPNLVFPHHSHPSLIYISDFSFMTPRSFLWRVDMMHTYTSPEIIEYATYFYQKIKKKAHIAVLNK